MAIGIRTGVPGSNPSAVHDVNLAQVLGTATAVNAGAANAGTQRVILASNDPAVGLLTTIDADTGDMVTSLQLLDNIVAAVGAAHGTGIAVIGFKAETTVPTAVNDGEGVAAWADEYGRLVIAGYDPAQAAVSVSDVAPAVMQISGPTTLLDAVTANGASPAKNVQDYHNHTFLIIATNVTTGAHVLIEASLDGTNWVTITNHSIVANGNYYTAISDQQWHYVRASVADRTDGTYTVQEESGN